MCNVIGSECKQNADGALLVCKAAHSWRSGVRETPSFSGFFCPTGTQLCSEGIFTPALSIDHCRLAEVWPMSSVLILLSESPLKPSGWSF